MAHLEALADAVDGLFAVWDRPNSPGGTLGIIKNGEFVYQRGYGMSNLECGSPITSTSVFYIASTSKQFTAASILLLARQGELSLDDDIRMHVPEIPQYERPIRVRDLVYHTSGLRDYLELMLYAGRSYEDEFGTQAVVQSIARQHGLNFAPGTNYEYCNSNYVLLAEIVGRVTGTSLREFAADQIFTPLGMTTTHFDDDSREIVPHRVVSYEANDSGGFRQFRKGIDAVGDGNLLTTLEDLARWDENFYAEKVGGPGFTQQMLTCGELNDGSAVKYAAGLVPDSYRGLHVVYHAGGFLGFRAQLLRFPGCRVSIICLCNLAEIDPAKLAKEVADIYLAKEGIDLEQPEEAREPDSTPAPSISLASSRLAEYAGRYYSEELEATHALTVEGDRLTLPLRRQLGVLVPVGRDEFRVPELEDVRLAFTRGPGGTVSGFQLVSTRLRNLRFARLTRVKSASLGGRG